MYRELELLSNLDFRFHADHPFRFASHSHLRWIHHDRNSLVPRRGDEHFTLGVTPPNDEITFLILWNRELRNWYCYCFQRRLRKLTRGDADGHSLGLDTSSQAVTVIERQSETRIGFLNFKSENHILVIGTI